MFSLIVKDAQKTYSPADNATVLVVEADILDKQENVVETRKFGFPLGFSDKQLQEEMKKFIATYNDDYQHTLAAADEVKTDEAIDKIVGQEFTV